MSPDRGWRRSKGGTYKRGKFEKRAGGKFEKKRGNFKKSAGKSVKDGATGSGNTSLWRQGVTATSLPELGLAGRQGVRVN
ncbi:hypothetical protein, partial [Mesomycoplasma ovipneumoniae]